MNVQKNSHRRLDAAMRTIYESLPVGIGFYSADGALVYVNSANCRMFGIDPVALAAYPVYAGDQLYLPLSVRNAIRNGESVHLQFPFLPGGANAQGEGHECSFGLRKIDCKGEPLTGENGVADGYVCIFEEIGGGRQAEERACQALDKTEIALKASEIMLWEFDVPTKLFYSYNEPMNGYDRSQPLTIAQYLGSITPEDRGEARVIIRRMVNGEDFTFGIDVSVLFPGRKEWQFCSVSGSPYRRRADGKIESYVGIRKNNTELRQRKLLQDKILNSIPLLIQIKDVENDYRYVFCNDESKKQFGISEGMTACDVMEADDAERIRKSDLGVFKTGVPYLGMERIPLKDGRIYDTIVNKSIIDDNGKRLLLSIRWDQGLQNELKRRSKLFSLTLESMNAFTWFYEPEKEQLSFGDGFDKFRRNASEIDTLEKFTTCVHPDDVERFIDSLQAVIGKENGVWQVECRLDMDHSGTYKWWEAHGILETTLLNDAPFKYMFGMSICIEPHKQAEMTLMRHKEELNRLIRQNELILNNANSGLAYITTDYVVQWENVSFCSENLSFEAYKRGEYCYKSARNRTSPCEDCVLQRTLLSRQMEKIQFTLDNHRMIEVFATPIFGEIGDVEGVVIRVDDVTERQQMINELESAKTLAEQSDKLKSAFLANMSHEIRTPLNAIVGFSELLMSTTGEEDRTEFVNIIKTNNELLLNLISDILDLSKIEAGSLEFVYEEFDLPEYFNTIVLSMRRRVTNPDVRLVDSNPYSRCRVRLDKNRVAQLIGNFVTNAIKYTPHGIIEMGYECTGPGVRFYVRDSGIGISDDKKDKVFHRFAKLDEFAQGTGLGLSICKAIAESMGGEVGFESCYGEGSLFWAFLPCEFEVETAGDIVERSDVSENAGDVEVATGETECGEELMSEPATILIAEDIQSNYLLLSGILQKHYTLLHASDGYQTVELVRNHRVDLLFMEMNIPVMNGLEVVSEIRKFNRKLPVIGLTDHAFETDRVAALACGCNELLAKPVDKARLMAVLKKYNPVATGSGYPEIC